MDAALKAWQDPGCLSGPPDKGIMELREGETGGPGLCGAWKLGARDFTEAAPQLPLASPVPSLVALFICKIQHTPDVQLTMPFSIYSWSMGSE